MRSLGAAVLLLALLLLAGCGGTDGELSLREWRFTGPDGDAAEIALPIHVDDRLPRARAAYTLHRAVTLGPLLRGRDLVFVVPRLPAHARLRVDGVEAKSLEDDEGAGYRAKGPHAWRIPADATRGESIAIDLEVEHTWTQSGWLDTVPRLTTAGDGGAAYVALKAIDDAGDFGALGLALFAGYLYLVVFLADRRRSTYLWFALTGITGFAYPLFQTALAQRLLGPAEVTMAGVGVASAVTTQIHFTRAHFGEPPPARAWDVAWGVVVLASIASSGYFTGTRVTGIATVGLALPAILAQAALLAKLARRKPAPVNLYTILVGWVLLPLLGLPDFAAWCGLGEMLGGVRTANVDITLIALLQTAAMSREHTRSLRRADDLAAEREARIKDLEVLNDELRRQIAARSRDLGDAIARLVGSGERDLLPGEVIEGRYAIVRRLGSGAAGSVYLVERSADRALLAMKVVRGRHEPHALARLAREAQLAATVKHENVIQVVDVDVASSGFLYVVMEYVSGETLREHRAEYGKMKWSIEVLRQIASGLAAIHERGIVHRDLKPANVLLVPRADRPPLVKIADFGIAGIIADAATELVATRPLAPPAKNDGPGTPRDLRLTETGVLLGTPLYMAPEAIDGAKNAAPPIDVFSFGVIAYEVLTGEVPFHDSPALSQGLAPPKPIGATHPEVPAHVAARIDRCLAFDPALRPTASELRDALADEESAPALGPSVSA